MASKSDDWQSALRTNRVKIVKGLSNANAVADCLYSDKILTEEMRDTIFQINEPEKKTRELLDILNRRGKRSISCLYNAFQQTGNEELANLLIDHVRTIEENDNLNEPKTWPPTEAEQEKMVQQKLLTIKDLKTPWLHEYNKDDVYTMQNRKRGKVIIINNMTFNDKTLGERKGSDRDVKNMTNLFQELQFEVTTNQNDLTAEEIATFLEDERTKTNWKPIECLVLILMSHGEAGCIYGSDGKTVKLDDLTNIFSSAMCKDLDGKPRLVFVQACRGESKGNVECVNLKKTCDAKHASAKKEGASKDVTDSAPFIQQSATQQDMKHPLADFLVAFATPEGTVSYRHTSIGSWFLCAVMWAFKYYSYKEELHHLLIRVNRIVARGKGLPGHEDKFTVSEVRSNLRKKLYFFPGVHGNPASLIDK